MKTTFVSFDADCFKIVLEAENVMEKSIISGLQLGSFKPSISHDDHSIAVLFNALSFPTDAEKVTDK